MMQWSNNSEGLKINPDAIIQVNSGLLNEERNKVVGYLNKALKPIKPIKYDGRLTSHLSYIKST